MRNDTTSLLLAAGLGAISGIRSISGIALLSLNQTSNHTGGLSPVALLRSKHADKLASTMALGEMVADKTADLPPRTDLPSLIGRAGFGALSGLVVAELRGSSKAMSALVGACAAIGSAHLFYHARRLATEQTSVPDWVVGLAEDTLAVASGKALVNQIR